MVKFSLAALVKRASEVTVSEAVSPWPKNLTLNLRINTALVREATKKVLLSICNSQAVKV